MPFNPETIDHSVSSFKEAVLKLANDKELRIEMGKSGRKIIEEKFTKVKVINQYTKLLQNIT